MVALNSSGDKPLPPVEVWTGMLLFLLPPLLSIPGMLGVEPGWNPSWLVGSMLVLFLVVMTAILAAGILRGLPRWSLPYLGFVILVGMIFLRTDRIWSWLYPLFLGAFGPRSLWSLPVRLLYGGAYSVVLSLMILLVGLLLVFLLGSLPLARGLWARLRSDWTQFSYIYYGSMVFGIHILFEEYRYEDPWRILAWAGLAGGAWWYLHAGDRRSRLLALIIGMTAALWSIALAKWLLIPLQAWPAGYPVSPAEVTRWTEAGGALVNWLILLAVMITPAAIDLLPGRPGFQTGQPQNES